MAEGMKVPCTECVQREATERQVLGDAPYKSHGQPGRRGVMTALPEVAGGGRDSASLGNSLRIRELHELVVVAVCSMDHSAE